jgi:hypothetical protein
MPNYMTCFRGLYEALRPLSQELFATKSCIFAHAQLKLVPCQASAEYRGLEALELIRFGVTMNRTNILFITVIK